MEKTHQTTIQSKVFDFALTELVLNHRNSFQPMWTIDSWVKFLIWMALNCGLNGERESLELFAQSMGDPLIRRIRKIFFERTLEELSFYVLADPAESHVIVMPFSIETEISNSSAVKVLKAIGLHETLLKHQSTWEIHERIISIPWEKL
tara:strand:+ start:1159 stop:1605 length:447 start_codon:yes stop_codon:yes gene_type:complete